MRIPHDAPARRLLPVHLDTVRAALPGPPSEWTVTERELRGGGVLLEARRPVLEAIELRVSVDMEQDRIPGHLTVALELDGSALASRTVAGPALRGSFSHHLAQLYADAWSSLEALAVRLEALRLEVGPLSDDDRYLAS